ncbi:endoplasmic reticulum-Golgi intermediate compartment 2-like [Paramuricea clavata]|uniref:Endoplasmic reticulum-Golgi intermediate compartment 2-like n=1 Tax=Paramuricea clavata TaxID=317549 RepID=A0A6S7G6M6_PARCT|nr:endoplasmic reticulum-Golgi intermediate compartment 2-like [Paramuricea clavata]
MLSWRNVLKTNQYSVTQRSRKINHVGGSHGVSGVFFKYDLSSILVRVDEVHRPFWQFLVRLCGIVGGIFATSGEMTNVILILYVYSDWLRTVFLQVCFIHLLDFL